MITMILHPAEPARPTSSGEFFGATTEWSGRQYRTRTQGAPTMELARVLVAAGCPDEHWQATRGGAVAMFGPSVHRLAGRTVIEGDASGPRFGRFVARPADVMPDRRAT